MLFINCDWLWKCTYCSMDSIQLRCIQATQNMAEVDVFEWMRNVWPREVRICVESRRQMFSPPCIHLTRVSLNKTMNPHMLKSPSTSARLWGWMSSVQWSLGNSRCVHYERYPTGTFWLRCAVKQSSLVKSAPGLGCATICKSITNFVVRFVLTITDSDV